MLSNGGKISKIDPAELYWHDREKLSGVIAVHVDDFFWSGSLTFEKTVITKLLETFKAGKDESVNFKYLGLEMQQHSGSIYLDQSEYIENLDLIQLDPKRQKENASLTGVENDKSHSKIGQLLWLSNQT